mmetsp:Transcript_38041/g.106916  ORF Transcript_38041/g.106916 Transcript_38041/m.106916 type:complete len:502 (-) Transcript_38041:32-1537(-)
MERGGRVLAASGLVCAAVWVLQGQDSDKDLTLGGHVSAAREAYIEEKTQIDRGVMQRVQHLEVPSAAVPFAPKVAFLFLTKQKLHNLNIWKSFFRDAPRDRYSIYVHESRDDVRSTKQSVYQPLAEYGAQTLPFINGTWCALAGLEAGALQMMLQDPNNAQFAVLSDSCIPLKSFAYVYHELVELSPKTSKVCLAETAQYRKIGEQMKFDGSTGCVFRDFYSRYEPLVRHHHQWAVLSREHAATFVRRGLESHHRYYNAWRQAVPDWAQAGYGCSCEATPLASLLVDMHAKGQSSGDYFEDLKLAGVEQKCLTFVHWHGCFVGHKLNRDNEWKFIARILQSSPVYMMQYLAGHDMDMTNNPLHRPMNSFPYEFRTAIEMDYLNDLADHSFMFARKFHPGVQVLLADGSREPLDDVLPRVWRRVDEAGSSGAVWTRLRNPELPPPYSLVGRVVIAWFGSMIASLVSVLLCDHACARALPFTLLMLTSVVMFYGLIFKSSDIN